MSERDSDGRGRIDDMETGSIEEYTREGIAENLGTRVLGRYIRWHETLPSTNDLAVSLAEIQVPEGTIVVAEEQTAGRGRHGRPWVSPRGGIWLSVILRPHLPLALTPLIGLAASVAAARAIRTTTGLLARVKWPNDVLIDGRKIVGILADAGPDAEWVVVGIGINANVPREALPAGTGYPITSLEERLGRPVDRGILVRTLLRELERGYEELCVSGALATLRRWREMADTLGRVVRVETHGTVIEGVASDLDESGALLVRLRDGTVQRVLAGEITVREVG
jgi:BirA family transcriptional regulator, biotin operon repressor / biotin---[acetyl-CoA-carboxylase] ligase